MYSVSMKKTLSLLLAFAMVLGMVSMVNPLQAKAATVEVAIANGDFENGAFGGAINGSNGATIVEKATYEGNYALKFDATGEILTVTGYLAEATTAESTVTLSFWAKVMGGSTGNSVNFGLFPDDANWKQLVTSGIYGAGYPIVGGDWKQITKTLTVPAGLKIVQAQIYLGSEGTTAIVDSVSITVDGNELLQSGNFEKGVLNGDFNANNALEIVCTPVYGGNYAAHADKSAGNGAITTTVSFDPSSSNRTMNFNYWMYAPTSANGAHNQVAFYDTSSGSWNNLGVKYGAQYAAPGQWVQKTLTLDVPANTNTLQVMLYAQDPGADFYIDDITLTEEVAQINHDVTLTLNQVTGDGTWQFSISEATADKYYKVPAVIDGVECNFLMGESGGIMCVYPNFFPALGGVVPTQQIVIAEGAVLKAVDANNGWQEIACADTYTITETIDLSYVDGAWGKTVYTKDITLELSQVTGDGTWQFAISETPADKYYKVPAVIDGVACEFLMGESGGIMCVYPNFFTALGGAVPTEQIVIAEGAHLKAVDSTNGWQEIADAEVLVVTEKIDLSYVDGVWGITVPNVNTELFFNQVTGDGTWQFMLSETPANKYYEMTVVIDGAEQSIWVGNSDSVMCVYPSFFQGAIPASTLTIPAGTVMKAVDDKNNWNEIAGAETLTITNALTIENVLGAWKDMSQYAGVDFVEIKASDLNVYRTEDQSASQYRSTFGISSSVAIGNDGWANFNKVAFKVLVDGVETDVHFGMVPATEPGWGAESAFLLYITGEGYWDTATTASSVTICAGTMIISPLDNTKGFKFTEDFVMYKNEDGSWDTTEDPEIEKQEITLGLNTITGDGTWQLGVTGEAIPNGYYKIPAMVDGNAYNVLAQYNGEILIIYPNFFPALGGAVPAESLVIAEGAVLKAVDSTDGWKELEATPVVATSELKVENIYGKWYETSKYADVNFTEIYAADLDLYYQNIMRLSDYSDFQVESALKLYPQYKDLYNYYGRNANMTTFGIKSTIPTLQIPNDAHWSNFTVIGKVSVNGAEPLDTYVMQTPASGTDDSETAMDSAFLIRFYNGYVADQAISITIEPGTKIITKDGVGFEFVDGYTLYRGADGNWTEDMPAGTNPVQSWGLVLGDDIGVKFQINANEAVTFAVNGNATAAVQDGNYYTISVAAAQMNDPITIYVGGVALEKTYTVRGYADIILADKLYGEATHNLVKAMLVYGGAAQTYFGYNDAAENLASNGITANAEIPNGETAIAVTDDLDGINFYGASLVHRNKTAVRFYFTGSVEGLTCSQGELVAKDDMYYVEISNINPQNLGDTIELVISDGTQNLSVSYSLLIYMVRMYNNAASTDAHRALVQAMYNYYLAAVAYV